MIRCALCLGTSPFRSASSFFMKHEEHLRAVSISSSLLRLHMPHLFLCLVPRARLAFFLFKGNYKAINLPAKAGMSQAADQSDAISRQQGVVWPKPMSFRLLASHISAERYDPFHIFLFCLMSLYPSPLRSLLRFQFGGSAH
jgi:hypothetical protein